jgi:type VI secretion system protein ImpH
MGAGVGRETDAVAFFEALAAAPYSHDFYQTMRRLECVHPDRPRWGEALRPIDEPVRLGQEPDLSFAPAPLAWFGNEARAEKPRLLVRLFGLLGPNGPLPIHLTEYIRERERNAGDPTLPRFLDLFHHRFLALFYRAWAQAQPHVNRDRPDKDRFASYIGAFIGIRATVFRRRDTVPDEAKLFHAGVLVRHVRNADGLGRILRHFFQVPVSIEEFVGHYMVLDPRERTLLAREGAILGGGAVLGARVWDRQHRFRIQVGSLTLMQYESFLPGGARLKKLADWVRFYLSYELDWDVQLILKQDEVPPLTLDRRRRLGWTTWLGTRRKSTDADDLRLHVETVIGRAGASVA